MVCLYMKACVDTPRTCDICKFGKDCAMINMFIVSKIDFDEFDKHIDEFSELSKVLNKKEYDEFCSLFNFLVDKIKKEGAKMKFEEERK